MALKHYTTPSHFTPEELATELFQPIPDWEGLYSASNLGRIRSDRAGSGTRPGYILTPKIAKGYPQVALYRDRKATYRYVHQLVLLTFEGPCPDGHEVSHRDGEPFNNRLTNLWYKTKRDHARYDATVFGRQKGSLNPAAIVNESIALIIRERYAGGRSTSYLAKEYGIETGTIHGILTGKSWKHVGGPIHKPDSEKFGRTLSDNDVREICRRLLKGERQKDLAAEFNVATSTISKIANGKKWQHIVREFLD